MNLDFAADINRDYADALNYRSVDRFIVAILWWHFGAVALLAFTNSVLRLAAYFPSPFAWRVISLHEAAAVVLVGWSAALIPTLLRGRLGNHYFWRILISVALTTFSYLFVFVSGGSIEMHFHFFMIMALLVIYSDWRLGWIVCVLTALHHVILNYLQPQWVYFYGRNDFSVVAHIIPVIGCAVFTTLLCANNRRAVEVLEDTKSDLEHDVLQRTRAEEALRASEERWRAVFENSAIGVVLTEITGRFFAANAAYQKMLGYSEAELRSLTFLALTRPEDREESARYINDLLEGRRRQFRLEQQHRRKDGAWIWVSNNVSLVPGTESMPRFLMALSEDITERKLAEDRLRETELELAHATRVSTLGEMTASISHEINQPLTAVVNNAGACVRWLAGAAPNIDEAREAAQRIIRDGRRAGAIIGRIRALVKKTGTEKTSLDVNEVIQDTAALAHPEIRRNGVELRVELAETRPRVLADRVQLQQVILNLIMNGIDAVSGQTERPRELLVRSCENGADRVLVAVRDSGVGIQPQDLEKIFDPFYSTKPQGMGMGLAISRSIIENHGGRIWAAPNDGPGATFQFTLLKFS